MNSPWLLPVIASLGAIVGWRLTAVINERKIDREVAPASAFVVATTNAAMWTVLAVRLRHDDLGAAIPAYGAIASVLVVQSWIDVRERRLPRAITFVGVVLGGAGLVAAAVVIDEPERIPQAGAGALIAVAVIGGIYAISNAVYGRGVAFGFGDVLLAPLLGLAMGWLDPNLVVVGVVFAFVLASLVAGPALLLRRATPRSHMPFGPFLAAGTLFAVLIGEQLIDAAFA